MNKMFFLRRWYANIRLAIPFLRPKPDKALRWAKADIRLALRIAKKSKLAKSLHDTSIANIIDTHQGHKRFNKLIDALYQAKLLFQTTPQNLQYLNPALRLKIIDLVPNSTVYTEQHLPFIFVNPDTSTDNPYSHQIDKDTHSKLIDIANSWSADSALDHMVAWQQDSDAVANINYWLVQAQRTLLNLIKDKLTLISRFFLDSNHTVQTLIPATDRLTLLKKLHANKKIEPNQYVENSLKLAKEDSDAAIMVLKMKTLTDKFKDEDICTIDKLHRHDDAFCTAKEKNSQIRELINRATTELKWKVIESDDSTDTDSLVELSDRETYAQLIRRLSDTKSEKNEYDKQLPAVYEALATYNQKSAQPRPKRVWGKQPELSSDYLKSLSYEKLRDIQTTLLNGLKQADKKIQTQYPNELFDLGMRDASVARLILVDEDLIEMLTSDQQLKLIAEHSKTINCDQYSTEETQQKAKANEQLTLEIQEFGSIMGREISVYDLILRDTTNAATTLNYNPHLFKFLSESEKRQVREAVKLDHDDKNSTSTATIAATLKELGYDNTDLTSLVPAEVKKAVRRWQLKHHEDRIGHLKPAEQAKRKQAFLQHNSGMKTLIETLRQQEHAANITTASP